jgi:hypothetical protein
MNDSQFFPVGSTIRYTADFTEAIPSSSPATLLSSVSWSISPQSGSPLSPTASDQLDDLVNYKSSIEVVGCLHGSTYVLQAAGTLSDGQTIYKDVSLVGFNG